jgi:hypothetical protein
MIMDTFEQKMEAMMKMPPDEQAKMVENLRSRCQCPGCPSYNDCAKNAGESLFCSTGKSFMCISNEAGCVCPTCPVAADMGLKYNYFCTRGAEKALRYEHTVWGASLVK